MVAAATLNPGPQQVVYAVGRQLAPGSAVQIAAAKGVATKYPNLHIRDYVYTDWTTAGGYSTMLGYLHAHPKTTIVVSDYGPDLTLGVVKAVAAAGETGKIKVIDFGGSSQIVPLIKSGVVQATVPDFPSRIGQLSVQSLTDAQAGKQPIRFVSIIPKEFGSYLHPRILVKSNLNGYKPEF
jgi:ABC-type sugar transport system substrate-binding protein